MKKNISIILMLFTFMASCKKEAKEIQETKELTQMERVMAVHDALMPEMSTIGKLTSALEPKIDSTDAGNQYKVAKEDLEASFDYMMEWMKGFGERFDSEEVLEGKKLSAEKQAWLNEEEEKVNLMQDMMKKSIANAEALLKKGQ